jgi:hypothetical protein
MESGEGVLLSDGSSRVFIHPPEIYGNDLGFRHLVDLVAGPFQGTVEASSYSSKAVIQSFHRDLIALHHTLRGKVELPNTYDSFKMSLEGDGLGHLRVRVSARAGDAMDIRLSFDFWIDQTQLPPIIAAVERLFLVRTE